MSLARLPKRLTIALPEAKSSQATILSLCIRGALPGSASASAESMVWPAITAALMPVLTVTKKDAVVLVF